MRTKPIMRLFEEGAEIFFPFAIHSQNATIFSMRLKGPSTSRPASYLNIDRKRRTPSVIARFNDKMYIILHIRKCLSAQE